METKTGIIEMFYKFTPDLMSKEDLEYFSIGREKIVSNIVKKLQNATSNNLSTHILLVGQRGIGKTHTLLQVYHKLNELNNFTAIRLSEEEYSITSVENLFKRILEELDVEFNENNIEVTALDIFSNLKNQKKFPVIFVDNLQMLFEQIGDELPKLRSILQEYNPFCIVGSALTIFHGIASHDEPFYNFMDVIFLKGLDVETMTILIKKRFEKAGNQALLKNFENYKERIRGIHILTGGNPRLVHSLCEILLQKNSLMDLESNLLELLDQLTPYYQVRMEQLPVIQRKLIDTLSQEKGPTSPTELARITKMKVANVVTQLRRLENEGVVESIKFRDKRETSYQVTERLYRIWREMRSPVGLKRISLLIDFLKIWYTKEERVLEYEQFEGKFFELSKRSENDAKEYLIHACYILDTLPDLKILSFENTIHRFMILKDYDSAVSEIKKMEKFKKEISNSVVCMVIDVSVSHAKCDIAKNFSKFGDIKELTNERDMLENKLVEITENYKNKPHSIEQVWLHEEYHKLATSYTRMNDLDKAEKYVDLSMSVITYTCPSSIVEKSRILIVKEDFKNAFKFLSMIPKKEIERETYILKIGCLRNLGRIQDAEKMAIDLLNDGFENLFQILDAISIEELNALTNIINMIINKLSNINEDLQKEDIDKLAMAITHFIAHAMIENKNKLAEKLFELLEKIKQEHSIDAPMISIFPITELIDNNALEMAISFIDKLMKMDSIFKESLLPLNLALDYIKTENSDILEKIHKEYRDLIIDIISQISPKTKIPQQIVDSL